MRAITKFGIRVFATIIILVTVLLPLLTTTGTISWVQGYRPTNAPESYSQDIMNINVATVLSQELTYNNETSKFSLHPYVNLARENSNIMILSITMTVLFILGVALIYAGSLMSFKNNSRKGNVLIVVGIVIELSLIAIVQLLKTAYMQYALNQGWAQAGDSVYTVVGVIDGNNTLAYTLQATFSYGLGIYTLITGIVIHIVSFFLPVTVEDAVEEGLSE